MRLLHVDSGILGDNSFSRRLTARLRDRYRAAYPGLIESYRDLAAEPFPHLSGAHLQAQALDPSGRTPDLQRELEDGAAALEAFLAANVVIIGAPMYNFTVPSQLKAWIDRLAVSGRTFRYTATGPVGLVGDKKVIVVSTRGGFYGPGAALESIDHQESYLRAVFGVFFGVSDLSIVHAEGVNIDEDVRARAISEAERRIDALDLEPSITAQVRAAGMQAA